MPVERVAGGIENQIYRNRPRIAVLLAAICACWTTLALAQFQSAPRPEETTSTDIDSPEKRGDLYMVRKYYPEAVEQYQKAIAADPNNYALYNKSGIAYHQLHDYMNARNAYLKASALNPRFAPAVNNLAAVEYSRKRYKQSILAYLQALAITPNDAVIYSNLGTSYFGMKKYEYAMQAYKYALQLDPLIFQKSGRSGNIVQQRDEKNSSEFNYYLAKTYADLKDVENTLLYLRKAWEEGYKEMPKAAREKAFLFLADEPRYVELVKQIDEAEAKRQSQ